MIDFAKLSTTKVGELKTNPIDIYTGLDRAADTSDLRSSQSSVLTEWFNERFQDRDVIVKMHTGDGKTLVGLLMLYSKMNSGDGPVLYVCPNKYLVQQVEKESLRFGIPFVNIDKTDGDIPNDFLDGKVILGVTVQKLFNGRTKFGLDGNSVPVGCIVLDDAHACVESIKKAFTIRIKRENRDLYDGLFQLFHDDLCSQGEGSVIDIKSERDIQTFMSVPYWKWKEKKKDATQILSALSDGGREKWGDAFFVWPLLKDSLEECQMFISARWIEITPYAPRVCRFGSFAKAKQRILMSATTQEDSFFIKGLDFEERVVRNPIQVDRLKWSGEKLVILPTLIDPQLTRKVIIDAFFDSKETNYGVVSIIPSSFFKDDYPSDGIVFSDSDGFVEYVDALKNKKYSNKIVLVNRYDGVDLPDASCRLLVLDSKPAFSILSERYEDECRPTSDYVCVRIAQRIEQGLGRAVRGEKDYCIVLIIGADLVHFVRGKATQKYFSPQTRKQVEIGVRLSEIQKQTAGGEPISDLRSLIKQVLDRDEGWKGFYNDEMKSNKLEPYEHDLYQCLICEKKAEEYHLAQNNRMAIETIQGLINDRKLQGLEKGWYLQQIARYQYDDNRADSEQTQREAFINNNSLFKPDAGVPYKKVMAINVRQAELMRERIRRFDNYEELRMTLEEALAKLSFGVAANRFEGALSEIGNMLGFQTQRPDHETRKGPDVLFISGGKYAVLECKDEVKIDRREISKTESGQMDNHCGWFESQYGKETAVDYYMIIPTNQLSEDANFTHSVRIINFDCLERLKSNVRDCFGVFRNVDIRTITQDAIVRAIQYYKLRMEDFRTSYSVEVKTH